MMVDLKQYIKSLKHSILSTQSFYLTRKQWNLVKAEHLLMWHNKTFTNKGKVYLQHVKELISLMMKMMMIKCSLLLMYDKRQQYKWINL